jgi:hypothetical protein
MNEPALFLVNVRADMHRARAAVFATQFGFVALQGFVAAQSMQYIIDLFFTRMEF